MEPKPWPQIPVKKDNFREPPREYGILPFWFLNGELDPQEIRRTLRWPTILMAGGVVLTIVMIVFYALPYRAATADDARHLLSGELLLSLACGFVLIACGLVARRCIVRGL